MCLRYLVLLWCVVSSYMWCISVPKSGFICIKDGIKLIPQMFWRISKRYRIYTIKSRSIPLDSQIWKLWGIWLHCNTCGWCHHCCQESIQIHAWDFTSRSGTLLTLPSNTWEMNWWELEIAYMVHQRSMWMKLCASIRRNMVAWIRRYSLWGSSNTPSWMILHSWIKNSTRTSNKLLEGVNGWFLQSDLT